MKKLLIAATVVLVSSSPLVLLPMEKELTLTQKQVQKLTQNTTASLAQFKQIPCYLWTERTGHSGTHLRGDGRIGIGIRSLGFGYADAPSGRRTAA